MSVTELQIKRAQVRTELDHLMHRYRRLGERLDHLAKELDTLDTEIAVAKMQRDFPEPEPRSFTKLEIV